MTPFDLILHFSLEFTAIRLRAKFEVSSFNRSRDIRGCQSSKCESRDPHMTPFDLILHFSLELTAIRFRAKFEVSSFNRSRDIQRVPQFPFWPNFAHFGYFFPFSICLSNLTRIASSMTDIWLLYDFAVLAAKCLFGPILGNFGGFSPPKIVKLLF